MQKVEEKDLATKLRDEEVLVTKLFKDGTITLELLKIAIDELDFDVGNVIGLDCSKIDCDVSAFLEENYDIVVDFEDKNYIHKANAAYIDGDGWTSYENCVLVITQIYPTRRGEYRFQQDNSFFYCERSGKFYCDRIFNAVDVDGEDICLELYEDELYWWESDSHYHWEEEHLEEEHSEYLYGYHKNPDFVLPSRESNQTLIGLEIEVFVKERKEFCENVTKKGELYCTEDSSLDDDYGVEAVFRPQTLDEIRNGAPLIEHFTQQCHKHHVKGHNAGVNYGLHITMDYDAYSELTWSKALFFIVKNSGKVALVAQRTEGYNKINNFPCLKSVKKGNRKHSWMNFKWRLVEWRMFRSNTRFERILKNIEFSLAVLDFSKITSIQDFQNGNLWEMFNKFLLKNKKDYRNLIAFLKEKCQESIGDTE